MSFITASAGEGCMCFRGRGILMGVPPCASSSSKTACILGGGEDAGLCASNEELKDVARREGERRRDFFMNVRRGEELSQLKINPHAENVA
jgi:hypothetical protein